MDFLFKHKVIISVVGSLMYCALILPITEAVWFSQTVTDRSALLYSHALRALLGIVLFFAFHFILVFWERLRRGDKFYKNWLIHTAAYGALMAVIMLLIFPGFWQWDEFVVLTQSQSYTLFSWQHVFTQIQYILSLYLIPSSTGITIIQIVIISSIVGYITSYIRSQTKKPYIWLLSFVPFLSLPVILGNFYTLRLHLYAYLLALLFIKIIQVSSRKKESAAKVASYLGITVLISLLAFWRSEGLLYLLTLPLFAYKLNILPTKPLLSRKNIRSWGALLLTVIIFGGFYTVTTKTSDEKYSLTAVISPLSMMVNDDLKGADVEVALEKVNSVLSVDVLKKYPSYTEIPSVWSSSTSVFQPNYTENMAQFYSGLAYIVTHNYDLFLKYKTMTFLATNSMDSRHRGSTEGLLTTFSLSGCSQLDENTCRHIQQFESNSKLNTPFNPELRDRALSLLLLSGIDEAPGTNIFRSIVWNVLPVVLFIVCALVIALTRRQHTLVFIAMLLLIHCIVIFITAPANYFMYYFPIYLSGSLFAIFVLIELVDRRRSKV